MHHSRYRSSLPVYDVMLVWRESEKGVYIEKKLLQRSEWEGLGEKDWVRRGRYLEPRFCCCVWNTLPRLLQLRSLDGCILKLNSHHDSMAKRFTWLSSHILIQFRNCIGIYKYYSARVCFLNLSTSECFLNHVYFCMYDYNTYPIHHSSGLYQEKAMNLLNTIYWSAIFEGCNEVR